MFLVCLRLGLRGLQKHGFEVFVTLQLPFFLVHIHHPFRLLLVALGRYSLGTDHPATPLKSQTSFPASPPSKLHWSPYRSRRLQHRGLLSTLLLHPSTPTNGNSLTPPLSSLLHHLPHTPHPNLPPLRNLHPVKRQARLPYTRHILELDNRALMVWPQDDFYESAMRFDEGADAGIVDGVGDVEEGESAGLDFGG